MKIIERYDFVKESSDFVFVDAAGGEHYIGYYNHDEHGYAGHDIANDLLESICRLNKWEFVYDEVCEEDTE